MSAHGSGMHAATRSELHRLLVTKLIAKYGVQAESAMGVQNSPANRLIQAEVDLFMHGHNTVRSGDLAELEGVVRRATMAGGDKENNGRPATARSRATSRSGGESTHRSSSSHGDASTSRIGASLPRGSPRRVSSARSGQQPELPRSDRSRPSTAGSARSQSHSKQQKKQSGRGALLPSSTGDTHVRRYPDDDGVAVPQNLKNEWLILETYQQLMADEKQEEEERQEKAAIARCRRDLDKQVLINSLKAKEKERETEAWNEVQRQSVAQHEAHQVEVKEASRKKLLEEKCVRAAQILANERRRERERREHKIDDQRVLAECKKKLAQEKEAQLEKRKQVAQALRGMRLENEVKLAAREKQRLSDAEEDKRIMQEYRDKLDKQQAERAAANAQRLLRYEMIGARWAESGAGKKQHDIDVAEERRVLTEAARKEKADEERERRDKEALRRNRLQCVEDNRRLVEEKAARKKAEDEDEAEYARQFRSEGERHVAKGVNRKREIALQQRAYARNLKAQMEETRAARAAVQMTVREREMNGTLIRLLQQDRDLQEKVSRRLLQQGPQPTKNSTGGAAGGEVLSPL